MITVAGPCNGGVVKVERHPPCTPVAGVRRVRDHRGVHPLLACSDCYARSSAGTYGVLGALTAESVIALGAAWTIRKRHGVRPVAAAVAAGLIGLLLVAGLALPAMPVSGWQPQPNGPKYELICGSAIHATLQGWTEPAGDPLEARDRAYCAHWGAFNVHLGEGLSGAAALLSLAFLTVVAAGGRKPGVGAAVMTA